MVSNGAELRNKACAWFGEVCSCSNDTVLKTDINTSTALIMLQHPESH